MDPTKPKKEIPVPQSSPKQSFFKQWLLNENIVLVQFIFLKLFTLIYIIAFTSLFVQIPGLFGKDGLLPVRSYLDKIEKHVGPRKYNVLPTIFWIAEKINKYILIVFPSLQEFQAEDNLFHFLCLINIIIGLGVLFDNQCKFFFKFWAFFVMWASYLSIFLVGQTFLSFQWDILILETGFLAMFFVPNKKDGRFIVDELSVVARELLRWLAFRYLFANGVVKLLSADKTWWSLTALDYHFESQPLPSPFSKWWHFLPDILKRFGVAHTLILEIFLPILFYAPFRTLRIFTAVYQIPFQINLMITGNFNWFNLHTVILCIPLLDDNFLLSYTPNFLLRLLGISDYSKLNKPTKKLFTRLLIKTFQILSCSLIMVLLFVIYFPYDSARSFYIAFDMSYLRKTLINSNILRACIVLAIIFAIFNLLRYGTKAEPQKQQRGQVRRSTKVIGSLTFFFLVFFSSLHPFLTGIEADQKFFLLEQGLSRHFYEKIQPFHIVNSYGLFRVMTGVGGRPELIIQGSYNNQDWVDYEFFYKPGKLEEKSKFNLPHQPRLDWQMWFAALGDMNHQPWLANLMGRLFSNSPSVLELLEENQFRENPPNYLRIKRFKYAFDKLDSEKEWRIINPRGEDYLPSIHRDEQQLKNYLLNSGFQHITKKSEYPVHPLQRIPLFEIVVTLLVIYLLRNIVKSRKSGKKVE